MLAFMNFIHRLDPSKTGTTLLHEEMFEKNLFIFLGYWVTTWICEKVFSSLIPQSETRL